MTFTLTIKELVMLILKAMMKDLLQYLLVLQVCQSWPTLWAGRLRFLFGFCGPSIITDRKWGNDWDYGFSLLSFWMASHKWERQKDDFFFFLLKTCNFCCEKVAGLSKCTKPRRTGGALCGDVKALLFIIILPSPSEHTREKKHLFPALVFSHSSP